MLRHFVPQFLPNSIRFSVTPHAAAPRQASYQSFHSRAGPTLPNVISVRVVVRRAGLGALAVGGVLVRDGLVAGGADLHHALRADGAGVGVRLERGDEGVVGLALGVGAAVHEAQLRAGRGHAAHVAHEAGRALRALRAVARRRQAQRRRRQQRGRPRAQRVHALRRRHAAHLQCRNLNKLDEINKYIHSINRVYSHVMVGRGANVAVWRVIATMSSVDDTFIIILNIILIIIQILFIEMLLYYK